MKITTTKHDGRSDNGHVIDYDTAIVFRFLPAATGEGFGTVWDGFSEGEWSLEIAGLVWSLLVAFGLGA
jgi:hypothetical protein